ncbi:MAG TPA: hypothetical protein VD978_28320 [Azospirillum sp.]|nr:hypothetical protein [Azospirillum sp.]
MPSDLYEQQHTRRPRSDDVARKEKEFESRTVELPPDIGGNDILHEPPKPRSGRLVPGSQFSEEQWERAAYMIAAGCAMMQVAKTMGASRATIWRAYTTSADFRERIWWERQHLIRESKARIRSLRNMVATQLEHAVNRGDMTTVRWLARQLGVVEREKDEDPAAFRGEFAPSPEDVARFAAMPEEERPYGYPFFPPDATIQPLPIENLP